MWGKQKGKVSINRITVVGQIRDASGSPTAMHATRLIDDLHTHTHTQSTRTADDLVVYAIPGLQAAVSRGVVRQRQGVID